MMMILNHLFYSINFFGQYLVAHAQIEEAGTCEAGLAMKTCLVLLPSFKKKYFFLFWIIFYVFESFYIKIY
jgi:hypothetical protein